MTSRRLLLATAMNRLGFLLGLCLVIFGCLIMMTVGTITILEGFLLRNQSQCIGGAVLLAFGAICIIVLGSSELSDTTGYKPDNED